MNTITQFAHTGHVHTGATNDSPMLFAFAILFILVVAAAVALTMRQKHLTTKKQELSEDEK